MTNHLTMYKSGYFLLMCLFFLASTANGQSNAGPIDDIGVIEFQDSVVLKEPEIFEMAEVMPEFPGGVNALMKYLGANISYPEAARKNKTEGKVILKFYIDLDGSIQNLLVLKDGTNGRDGLAEEALRVVKAMPKWKPGQQRGKIVKVYYILPISFKLS